MSHEGPTGRAREILRELRATDLAVYRAVAGSSTPTLDRSLRRLSRVADHSVLWGLLTTGLAVMPGRPRRTAVLAGASVGVASATANIVAKRLVPRRRPDRLGAAVPTGRQVRMPASTSFPSGHAASAFAFATAVGSQLPVLSLPLNLLAATVAYSRVHTGVHYPGDTVIGAAIGSTAAAVTTRVLDRVLPPLGGRAGAV